eukprot:942190_1
MACSTIRICSNQCKAFLLLLQPSTNLDPVAPNGCPDENDPPLVSSLSISTFPNIFLLNFSSANFCESIHCDCFVPILPVGPSHNLSNGSHDFEGVVRKL